MPLGPNLGVCKRPLNTNDHTQDCFLEFYKGVFGAEPDAAHFDGIVKDMVKSICLARTKLFVKTSEQIWFDIADGTVGVLSFRSDSHKAWPSEPFLCVSFARNKHFAGADQLRKNVCVERMKHWRARWAQPYQNRGVQPQCFQCLFIRLKETGYVLSQERQS